MQYFGSTTKTIGSRFASHKNLKNNTTSRKVIECGDAICEWYASVKYDDVKRLRDVEKQIIKSNECVNINWNGLTLTVREEDRHYFRMMIRVYVADQ